MKPPGTGKTAGQTGSSGAARRGGGLLVLALCGLWFGGLWFGGLWFGDQALARDQNVPAAQRVITLPSEDVLPFIEKLILAGRLREAQEVLAQVHGRTPDPLQEKFLAGQIAAREGRYEEAIRLFRAILDRHPELSRVRLDLARAYFLAGKDGKARHHFELVLAGDLPPTVRQKVRAHLFEIRKRKRWQVRAYLALAPDSNIAAAPDQDTVTLFGLPFQLSEEARETSGLGMIGALGLDYFWPLSEKLRLKSGLDLHHTQYGDTRFNDTLLSGALGPRFAFRAMALTLQATGYRRWFGGEGYNHAYGGQMLLEHILSRRWRLEGTLSWQTLTYDRDRRRDGHLAGVTARLSYGLTSSSFVQLLAGAIREKTAERALENLSWRLGLGYYKDWGQGVTLYVRPELLLRDYAGVEAAFARDTGGRDRRDVRYGLRLDLTKRDWAFWDFAPVLGYSYTRNQSNIDFFDYDRHRVQIGVTRTF